MRICIVTAYDLNRDGGVNRHVLGLRDALSHMGDHVTVLGPASGVPPAGCMATCGVVGVPGNGSMAHIGLFCGKKRLLPAIDEGAFDVVHVHAPVVPGPSRMAAAMSSTPLVATFHSYASRESALSLGLRQLTKGPLMRIRYGIAVSTAARDFAEKIYPGPLRIVPNGIEYKTFASTCAPKITQLCGRPLQLLFVGRFNEPRKGLRTLLQAMQCLQNDGRKVQLVVAGHGTPARFASLTRSLQVQFTGRLSDAELRRAYATADIFCAPALDQESFGLVLVEAMAAGIPVVASDIKGYAEAAGGCAALAPAADAAALAETLWSLALAPHRRLQMQTRGSCRAKALDWARIAPQVREVYVQAMARSVQARERRLPGRGRTVA